MCREVGCVFWCVGIRWIGGGRKWLIDYYGWWWVKCIWESIVGYGCLCLL